MTKQIQLRGTCQLCARSQAVLSSGRMSKHGYTVEHGWFNGVCQGQRFVPMNIERTETDRTVAAVREEVATLTMRLGLMNEGKILPTVCKGVGALVRNERTGSMSRADVAFAECNEHQQREAVRGMIFATEGRIRMGTSFANDMEATANRVHGTALEEVAKVEAAPRVQIGERKQGGAGSITSTSVEGARVYWKRDNERQLPGAWMSTKAWRALTAA